MWHKTSSRIKCPFNFKFVRCGQTPVQMNDNDTGKSILESCSSVIIASLVKALAYKVRLFTKS